MRKLIMAALLAALVLVAGGSAAFAQGGISMAGLVPQNNSGQSGNVTLTGLDDGTTRVEIAISGGWGVPQPAHIHEGSCANLNPKPAFPLTSVVNGTSTTIVKRPITDLLGGRYAVNVHKSATEASVYVACGDLTALINSGGLAPGMPVTGAPGFGLPLAALLATGLLLVAGTTLRRHA